MNKNMIFIGNDEFVLCFEADVIGALAIHPEIKLYGYNANVYIYESVWIVTHIESGLQLTKFSTKKQSVKYAKTFVENINDNVIATYSDKTGWKPTGDCVKTHNVAIFIARYAK